MAPRNKRKLAALNKENCEEHPRSNLTQNSAAPRSQEDYITQVSEEIEGRVTKKLSQEFSRTENRILGALARLDGFLMNPLLQGHSGNSPEKSGNTFNTNQGTNEDDPQSDPHPEAGSFGSQMIRNSGQETCCDTEGFTLFYSAINHYQRKVFPLACRFLSAGNLCLRIAKDSTKKFSLKTFRPARRMQF